MVARRQRRGAGEGSIYQRRSDGRWVASIALGPGPDGKPRYWRAYRQTRREAADALAAALVAHQQDHLVLPQRRTVAEYLEWWLATAGPTIAPRTREHYQHIVRQHLIPMLGRHQLRRLRPEHVQALLAQKLASGLSAQTVKHIHSRLRTALSQAVALDLLPRNVALVVKPPSVSRHRWQPLSTAELQRLLTAAHGTRLEALWWLLVATGARRGECLGLRWADVLWDRQAITIQQQVQVLGGRPTITPLKTTGSRRALALPTAALVVLQRHATVQRRERLVAQDWPAHDLVFATRRGTPLAPRNVHRVFKGLLAQAGLPDTVRLHDLRHTHASSLLAAGVPVNVVAERLGHSRPSTTLNVYAHVLAGAEMQVTAQVAKLLPEPEAG